MTLRPTLGLLGLVVLLFCSACGPRHEIDVTRHDLALGDTVLTVVVHTARAPGLTYLNLHDNENTAVEAALDVLARHGGRLVELVHSGERNVAFRVGDSTYTFDPNRIFTDAGADTTLARLGASSPAAHAAVRAFADAVLALLDPAALTAVVTVHNNTEASYSVLSYTGGGDYEADALFVHVASDEDADDFFFVTERGLYDRLRSEGFNAVLQDNAAATDDGSLSVYAGREGLPYVNVEAQHGHRAEQIEMLETLQEILRPAQ